jgi:exopolyphosphatase/guanosine-5'-triphosphate,3'-diphosphate pyrophosphatase
MSGEPRHDDRDAAPRPRPGPASAPAQAEPIDGLRVAAVDIGSNSVRLEVAEARQSGDYRVLTDERETVGLGSTDAAGNLTPDRIEHALRAVSHMVDAARGYGAEEIELVATAAVRDAGNRHELIDKIREQTGLPVRVLTGDEEARFAHDSVAHAFDLAGVQAAVLDIGGGSTEIAVSTSGVIERLASAPIGAVRLTDRCVEADDGTVTSDAFVQMRRIAATELDAALDRDWPRAGVVFGTGGTFTTLAAIIIEEAARSGDQRSSRVPPGASVRGFELRLAEVAHLVHRLRRMDAQQLASVRGLSSSRSRIIIAGLVIVETAMRKLGVNTLRVHDRGVRDGVLLGLVRRRLDAEPDNADKQQRRTRGVLAFGRRCGFEETQSEHVRNLALSIYDQYAAMIESEDDIAPAWATGENRELLAAGALLRDVGYFVNYTKHHKHAYHLIVHADLPGFTPAQQVLIALIARYHRRAKPKKKHDGFCELGKADRARVRALAGILRLADGLDRTHTGVVGAVRLERQRDGLVLFVDAESEPAPDIWGGQRKADLFNDEFDEHLQIRWSGRAPAR